MPTRRPLVLLLSGVALLVPAAAAHAAGPATVTVQVESKAKGALVAPTMLTTTSGTFTKDGNPADACSRTSAGGALQQAAPDWTGEYSSFGYSVIGIGGEEHPFSGPDYWSLFVNGVPSSTGACDTELAQGDVVLFAPVCTGAAGPTCFTEGPLAVAAPASGRTGVPFTVTVTQTTTTYDADFNAVTSTAPAAGATVSGGGGSATTGADGKASLTLGVHGPVAFTVTKGDGIPARATVCLTDGADGVCGSPAPAATPTPTPTTPPAGTVPTPPAADTKAPVATLSGIENGKTYAKGKGPRSFAIAASDAGAVSVKLRLTRNDGGRCSKFSFRAEKFVGRKTCSTAKAAPQAAGTGAAFTYQLPAALGPGRYVLDVVATDAAGNADHLVRGRSRLVFRVG